MAFPSYLQIDKLEGTSNYNAWKLRMKTVLINQGLWNITLGREIKPDISLNYRAAGDSTQDLNDFHLLHQEWLEKNNKAYSLILLMVKDNVAQLVQDITDAETLWKRLETLYSISGFSARHVTLQHLYATSYENTANINTYIEKIKEYSLQLSQIGAEVLEWIIMFILLNNLGPTYKI